jgi:hypothetical protein
MAALKTPFLIGTILLIFASGASFAGDLVARIHANPPAPCVAKSIGDMSSGIAIFPNGKTDEQLRGIMGGLASLFLAEGAERMSPANTDVVYTAVFYQGRPIDEIGIYAYRFKERIGPQMFKAHKGMNGKILVLNDRLLVLLWHERLERTAHCFAALEQALLGTRD